MIHIGDNAGLTAMKSLVHLKLELDYMQYLSSLFRRLKGRLFEDASDHRFPSLQHSILSGNDSELCRGFPNIEQLTYLVSAETASSRWGRHWDIEYVLVELGSCIYCAPDRRSGCTWPKLYTIPASSPDRFVNPAGLRVGAGHPIRTLLLPHEWIQGDASGMAELWKISASIGRRRFRCFVSCDPKVRTRAIHLCAKCH